jgi:P-type Ca2+ transporter type 2C
MAIYAPLNASTSGFSGQQGLIIDTWHERSADDALASVTSAAGGLTTADARARRDADGPNALRDAVAVSPVRILAGQFSSLLVWILIAAGVVSGLLGAPVDAFAILAIVGLNVIIGFSQEFSAERSIAALKQMTAPMAKVLRDGAVVLIPSADVVRGDVLVLEAGDLVAADARLMRSAALSCLEAALTGESDAVRKDATITLAPDTALGDRVNMVYLGTAIATGTARAVVVATGMDTELGRIAGLLGEANTTGGTPLEQKLDALGRVLMWAALAIVVLLFLLGWMRGTAWLDLFMSSVSLAVAAVPEGLPTVVTVALSIGVRRMAQRRALVRTLASVETLGPTSVICTDKTGTLTVGEMTVRALYVGGQSYDVTGEGYGPIGEVRATGAAPTSSHRAPLDALSTILLGCNNAQVVAVDGTWKTIGDPTEGALLVAGAKAGGDRARLEQEMPKVLEFPFDSDRKRSSVVRRSPDGTLRLLVNGAPGTLLDRCTRVYATTGVRTLTDEDRKHILSHTSDMARHALRVLASAHRDLGANLPEDPSAETVERDLVFVGLAGMYDPPRPSAKDAINTCRVAGIRVVMITGDHPETASAIAREIGITTTDATNTVTGLELTAMSDETLRQRVPHVAVYARVSAEHKLRIIRAWRANGAVVAMTGDGVNDAPAIKGADIGIAMGASGTEVTRQAADIVLTDDHFATIVAAVEEGRGIYDNIRKTLQYLLAGNMGELLLMAACVIIGLPTPLLPIHLLWINLVTDGLPALALAMDPIDPDVMARHPRPREERITNPRFVRAMLLTGVLTAAVAMGVYWVMLQRAAPDVARTWAFTVLVFAELLRAFGARSETRAIWRLSPLSNRWLLLVVVTSLALQGLSHHNLTLGRFLKTTPMSLSDAALLFGLGAIPLVVLEIVKAVRRHRP